MTCYRGVSASVPLCRTVDGKWPATEAWVHAAQRSVSAEYSRRCAVVGVQYEHQGPLIRMPNYSSCVADGHHVPLVELYQWWMMSAINIFCPSDPTFAPVVTMAVRGRRSWTPLLGGAAGAMSLSVHQLPRVHQIWLVAMRSPWRVSGMHRWISFITDGAAKILKNVKHFCL